MEGCDDQGRTLEDYWEIDFNALERKHDFIQWMFPSCVRSRFNPEAPILDEETWETFRGDEAMKANLRKSRDHMLRFYGFTFPDGMEILTQTPDGMERWGNWISPGNHNFMRVTRILPSCYTLGLEEEAKVFALTLESIAPLFPKAMTVEVLGFWRDATRLG